MGHVAEAAGFNSIRRFNDTFRKTYGRAPRDLRRVSDSAIETCNGALNVRLPYRKPFDWRGTLAFLAGRATPGVEQVIGNRYLRTVVVNNQSGVIDCEFDEKNDRLRLTLHGMPTEALFSIVQRVRELLDLDAPVDDIADTLGSDPQLGKLLGENPGVRVPGAWDGFELTVRAILGQQVSVKAATSLAGRTAQRYGEHFVMPETLSADANRLQLTRLFPTPARLARARFHTIGLPGARADTIRHVARAVIRGDQDFDDAQDPDKFCDTLTKIRGIGDWTAQYVAMRALKNPDAFPVTDLGVLKAISAKGGQNMSVAALNRRAEAWRPWRAYATLLLWGSLANSGG
jgi:AraC family transcriptional regulator of adaptative response / DNA-3-methyladenine glycosylase II